MDNSQDPLQSDNGWLLAMSSHLAFMPRPETVEIEAGDDYAVETRIINAEDFDPDQHTKAGATDEGPEVDWEIADNGWWTITSGEEEISGRGEENLNETLQEMGVVR